MIARSPVRSALFSRPFSTLLFAAIGLALGLSVGPVNAQMPQSAAPAAAPTVFYPAKDQSPKQQEQDKYECYSWSKGQSGFDPAQATQTANTSQLQNKGGSTAGAMVVGAAGGAAVGELTHHSAGRGAAAGALGGGLLAKAKEKQAMQAAQQQAMQQQAARGQQKAVYDRAFGACMEARGYVVK